MTSLFSLASTSHSAFRSRTSPHLAALIRGLPTYVINMNYEGRFGVWGKVCRAGGRETVGIAGTCYRFGLRGFEPQTQLAEAEQMVPGTVYSNAVCLEYCTFLRMESCRGGSEVHTTKHVTTTSDSLPPTEWLALALSLQPPYLMSFILFTAAWHRAPIVPPPSNQQAAPGEQKKPVAYLRYKFSSPSTENHPSFLLPYTHKNSISPQPPRQNSRKPLFLPTFPTLFKSSTSYFNFSRVDHLVAAEQSSLPPRETKEKQSLLASRRKRGEKRI